MTKLAISTKQEIDALKSNLERKQSQKNQEVRVLFRNYNKELSMKKNMKL